MCIKRELIELARTAPLNGHILSGNFGISEIKERYNKSDYYIVEILEKLLKKDLIRELDVNYDQDDQHILSYKFK